MVAPHLFQILRCCGQFKLICLLVNTLIENEQTQTTKLNIDQNFISIYGEPYEFADNYVAFAFAHMVEFEYRSNFADNSTYASKLRDTRGIVLGSIAG